LGGIYLEFFVLLSCSVVLLCILGDRLYICIYICSLQWQADEKWIPFDLESCREIELAFTNAKIDNVRLTHGWFAKNSYEVHFKNRKVGNMYQVNRSTGNGRLIRRLGMNEDFLRPLDSATLAKLTADDVCSVCMLNLVAVDDKETKEAAVASSTSASSTSTATSSVSASSMSTSSTTAPTSASSTARKATTSKAQRRRRRPLFSTRRKKSKTKTNAKQQADTDEVVEDKEAPKPKSQSEPSAEKKEPVLEGNANPDQPVKLPQCTNHYFHRKCISDWIKLKGKCPVCGLVLTE
jgi:flagellar basal body rod protein FlgC